MVIYARKTTSNLFTYLTFDNFHFRKKKVHASVSINIIAVT